MMSPEAALRSDHVNLLIHRYLQESGFENAAKALHVDWQRHSDHRDPETLPFAHTLQRNELISVIQAGLHYDDLRARTGKHDRKFKWTTTRERPDGYIENGTGSRPASSGRRKAQTSIRASDDFPTPMPKRQRRSDGSDAQVNGDRDAADVDNADAEGDVDAEGEEDADVASPAVFSEPEAVNVERYDSVMTQTESKAVPKTSTLSWTIDKPGARLLESSWSPGSEHIHARTLLAVGDSICRLYEIPDSADDTLQIKSQDEPVLPDDAAVTAVAWRPDGEAASFAIDQSPDSGEQPQVPMSLVERSRDGSSAVFLLAPPTLEPAGIILSLKYSPNGEYLLAAKTNGNRGLVQIWKTARTHDPEVQTVHEPISWRMFEKAVSDIVWISTDTFVVCGDAGSSFLYQIDGSQQQQASEAQSTGSMAMRGLIALNSSILPVEGSWDHVRTDQRNKLAAFASVEAKKLVLTSRIHSPELGPETDSEINLTGELATLEFQPAQYAISGDGSEPDTLSPSLLAVALDEGSCCIYSVTRQTDGSITSTEGPTLSLAEGQISTLAWSSKGDYLAVGNADLVQIWHTNALKRNDGAASLALDAYVTWRPALEASGTDNDQQDDDSEVYQPSLSWSSDDSLAYAADKQIAILRFKLQQPETNGQSSPQRT